jgi:hypothetical protein
VRGGWQSNNFSMLQRGQFARAVSVNACRLSSDLARDGLCQLFPVLLLQCIAHILKMMMAATHNTEYTKIEE